MYFLPKVPNIGSINIYPFGTTSVSGGNGAEVPTSVEMDVLRILVQEERERPDYLHVKNISERLEDDYGADTVEGVVDVLDGRPGSALEHLSPDEDCVTLRDLEEAGDRLGKLMDQQRDDFFG